MTKVAISADTAMTADAGAQVARAGGNAVDVAVACALAATVSEVLMCSLGGSAFFMVRMPGKPAELIEGADAFPKIDRRPEKGSSSWWEANVPYGDGIRVMVGHASIAVPGMLAAAEKTWERFGVLPWSDIVAPAVELASQRIPTCPTLAGWLALSGKTIFSRQRLSQQCFVPDDQPLVANQLFQIPDLDQTLRAIMDEGAAALYRGSLTDRFVHEIQSNGGLIDRSDMEAYQAVVRKPLSIHSGGFEMALNPPPAVGGTAVGFLINAIGSAWNDRLSPAEKVQLQACAQLDLLNLRANELARDLDTAESRRLLDLGGSGGRGPLQSPNTTHFSVVSADGGMVAVTMSMGYGAGILIPELGIACNNGLGEPELNPQGFHLGQPGQRIISNMAPTVAWNESDRRRLAIGSPGASRITTSIAQTWLSVVLEEQSYEEAVTAPRIHLEPQGDQMLAQFEPGIDTSLLGPPLKLRPFEAPDWYFGGVKLAGLDRQGKMHAVADRRRSGAVVIVD